MRISTKIWILVTTVLSLAALAIKTLTAAVFGPQRTRSAAMCVRGVIDGIRGRAGPYAGVLPGRVPH